MPVSNLFEGDMRIFSIFALTALALPLVRGEVNSCDATIGITQGPDIFARIGDNVTLTCEVVGNEELSGTRIRWQHAGKNLIGGSSCLYNHSSVPSTCNHTVIDVDLLSKGLYTCHVVVKGVDCSSSAYLLTTPKPLLALLDISTGDLVREKSHRLCVPPGAKRSFECTLRVMRPDRWTLTWLLSDSEEVVGSLEVAGETTGRLVNATSRFTVTNPADSSLMKSLQCQATSTHGESIKSVTAYLQSCSGERVGVPIAVVAVVSVLSTLMVVVIGNVVVRVRRKRKTAQIGKRAKNNQPTVDMHVTSYDDPGVTGPFENRISQQAARKYEDRILTHVEQKYEDRISPQVTRKYEDKISPQVDELKYNDNVLLRQNTPRNSEASLVTSHKYEERILPQAAHKYEDKICSHVNKRNYDDDNALPYEEPRVIFREEDNLPSWAEGWKIPWSDLTVDDRILGRGNFGEVRSGAVRIDGVMITSAFKMLKAHASASEREDFLEELRTMTSIGHHPNVVSLLGACRRQEVLYVALEYLPRGDLRSYLRTARSQSDSDEDALSPERLVNFALNVAKGMEHLAKTGVIHRDLAARNILLGKGLIAKVSDFGLSRGEDIYVQTSTRRVPVRWSAIESLRYKKYTIKSDVWSFGIVLWEIATLGGTPYPNIRSELLPEKLKRGYRMPKPENCDEKSYTLMRKCWEEDPKNRPTFTNLVSILNEMNDSKIKHTYLSFDRLNYENLSVIQPQFDDN
ncbi:mitogen-activated protein kinase kinase kinase A-like [Acanthaster planci]|uniref:receptor protein-tyrosine kinase n=1 Tax=Acanthaster planci TaxID=133434 RepID=A0A8B8A1U3_ACAPL|nr:mitogen-activated protein kinase kinase kinase A-like [Acanthaster planci]